MFSPHFIWNFITFWKQHWSTKQLNMTSEKLYKYDPRNRVVQEKSILPVIRNDFEFTREKKMKKNKEKKIAIETTSRL